MFLKIFVVSHDQTHQTSTFIFLLEKIYEGLNRVKNKPSNSLKTNRKPSKKVIFSVNRQECS